MSWRDRVADALFGTLIEDRVALAVKVVDDKWWTQIDAATGTLDRDWTDLKEDLSDALEAWRTNPLARRIVALCTDYVVGSGIYLKSDDAWVQKFVDEFWRLNKMGMRLYRWSDELTRSGELFIVMRTDEISGASFVRAIPAVRIHRIDADPDDLERELWYTELQVNELAGRRWQTRYTVGDGPQLMLHYSINRPVGCVRGESDLSCILPWLKRYSDWLLNRARLNKYKTAFMWDVTIKSRPGRGDTVRKKRYKYKTPPEPGSIIVHGEEEEWNAISPKIEAWDAKEDGKAMRLAVAAGAGIPLHFLAEGESATKATAAEMGGPTFRHYYRRQLVFGDMLVDLVTMAIKRANARGRGPSTGLGQGQARRDLGLKAIFPDVTKQDNVEMAQAALLITRSLDTMAKYGWIDDESALTLALKFAGEMIDVSTVLERIQERGPAKLVIDPVRGGAPPLGDAEISGRGRPFGSVTGTGV